MSIISPPIKDSPLLGPSWSAFNARRGAASAITYLLNAPFTADNQSFSDAQVLDTEAKGVITGQLTCKIADGAFDIVSNEVDITAQTTPANGDLSMTSQAIPKSSGIAAFLTATSVAAKHGPYLVFTNTATYSGLNTDWPYMIRFKNTGALQIYLDVGVFLDLDAVTLGTTYQFAIVLGGYTSAGVPDATGLYGSKLFAKGGTEFTSWTLIYSTSADNTSTLYAYTMDYDSGGKIDNFKVANTDATLKALLSPTVLDTFTDSNGTGLDAHTMDAGSGWTEQSGAHEIQSNRMTSTTIGYATVSTADADILAELVVNTGTGNGEGIIIRYSDNDNLWLNDIHTTNDVIQIFEQNATTWTERASAAVTINASTDYVLKVIAEGTTITAFVDDGNKISYASASLNETETKHGIRSTATDQTFNNFAIYPRGTGSEYSGLDSY